MSHSPEWTADAHPIQQAARGIVCHYEGEAWKPPLDDFYASVNRVARLIAASPEMLAMLELIVAQGGSELTRYPTAFVPEFRDARYLIAKVKGDDAPGPSTCPTQASDSHSDDPTAGA